MVSDILEKAKEYIKDGRIDKAQLVLRRALADNPNQPRVLELCGDLVAKLGRIAEAVARYEHACENYTNNNQYAEAIICLEKVLKIDKPRETVLFQLVDLYRFFGLPNEALKRIIELCSWSIENRDESLFVAGLRKLVELQSKNLGLRLAFAKLLLALNRTQETRDELQKLRGLAEEVGDNAILSEIKNLMPQFDGGDELDPKSRLELGNLLYEIGSKEEAIIEFTKAAEDLIQENKVAEAINVLNRIVEIDPNNMAAITKIKELKTGKEPEKAEAPKPEIVPEPTIELKPKILEEVIPESKIEAPSEPKTQTVEASELLPIQDDLAILKELNKEIEGFSMVSAAEPASIEEKPPVGTPAVPQVEQTPAIEGQIADIEFLLKEVEAPPAPSFEVAKQFDEFRNKIIWGSDDITKKVTLAKMAYINELFDTAIRYLEDEKDKKEVWPSSLEIIGGSLVKSGRYSEAIKTIRPIILREEIPEAQKIELRYILASAYEGVGDFENALRQTEHIMAINPEYRDVKEIYELLAGKGWFEESAKPVTTPPVERPEVIQPADEEIVSVQAEEIPPIPSPEKIEPLGEPDQIPYPVIGEEPVPKEPSVPKDVPEEKSAIEKEAGENIAFL